MRSHAILSPRRAIGSWPNGWVIRHVTREDVRTTIGGDIDPAFCMPDTKLCGYAVLQNGELRATGVVTWDRRGRAWAWIDRPGHVPPATLHRCALEFLGMMRRIGEPDIRMVCNLAIPGSVKWVQHLGFVRDETEISPKGPVYRLALND